MYLEVENEYCWWKSHTNWKGKIKTLLEFRLPQLGTESWRAGGSLVGSAHMQRAVLSWMHKVWASSRPLSGGIGSAVGQEVWAWRRIQNKKWRVGVWWGAVSQTQTDNRVSFSLTCGSPLCIFKSVFWAWKPGNSKGAMADGAELQQKL